MTEQYMGPISWNEQHDKIDPYDFVRNEHVDRTTRLLERQVLPWFCNAVKHALDLEAAFNMLDDKFNPLHDPRERATLLKITERIRQEFTLANTIPTKPHRYQTNPPGKTEEEQDKLVAQDCDIVKESGDSRLILLLDLVAKDVPKEKLPRLRAACHALLNCVFGEGHSLAETVVDLFMKYQPTINRMGPYLFKIMEEKRGAVENQRNALDELDGIDDLI